MPSRRCPHPVLLIAALLSLLPSLPARADEDCATLEKIFAATEGDMLSLVRWDFIQTRPYSSWSEHDRLPTSASATLAASIVTSYTYLGEASVKYFFLTEAPWAFPAGTAIYVQSSDGDQKKTVASYEKALKIAERCLGDWQRQEMTAKGYYGFSRFDTLVKGVAFTREGAEAGPGYHVEVRLSRFSDDFFHAKLMVLKLGDGAPRPSQLYESPILKAARAEGASSSTASNPSTAAPDLCSSLTRAIRAVGDDFASLRGELEDSFMGNTYKAQVQFPGATSAKLITSDAGKLRLQVKFYDGLSADEARSRQKALVESLRACEKPCGQWLTGDVDRPSIAATYWVTTRSTSECASGLKVDAVRRSVPNVDDATSGGKIRDRWYVELGVHPPSPR